MENIQLNTIYNEDCLETMKRIPDGFVDLVLTDPPYGTTACKWDTVIPYEPMWEQLRRVTKDNGAIVLFGSQPFTSSLVMSNPEMFRYEWIWVKSRPNGFLDANRKPMKKHEIISVFSKGRATYIPQGLVLKAKPNKNSGKENVYGKVKKDYKAEVTYTNYPNTILTYSSGNNKYHPTQKPVDLLEYLIKTYTKSGEIVLDFTCGSGSTLVAAQNLNRNYIGSEISKEYCDIAERRLAQEVLL